jgi:hypothetical protein
MPQCSDDVQQLNNRLARVEGDVERIKTAFVLNDRGSEDYDGHRKDHFERSKAAEDAAQTMRVLKTDATKSLLKWLLTIAAGIFMLGVGPYLRGLMGV